MNQIKFIDISFPKDEYVQKTVKKELFIIHHSAGWDNVRGMFSGWINDGRGRICTAYGINDAGEIYRGFDASKYFGYALGQGLSSNNIPQKFKKYGALNDEKAIQVEICNWGSLYENNGKFYGWPVYNSKTKNFNYSSKYEVPKEKVISYDKPFRGKLHFERYTDAEIDALRNLILYHHQEDGIPIHYNEDMWDISEKALIGTPGVWGHVSFNAGKSDPHPQPELIHMLKNLNTIGNLDPKRERRV